MQILTSISKFFGSHKRELFRLLPLVSAAALILIPDSSSQVVLFSIGIILALVGLTHLLRKILFPYIDMEIVAYKAQETPSGAATVFLSITILLSVIILSSVMLLH